MTWWIPFLASLAWGTDPLASVPASTRCYAPLPSTPSSSFLPWRAPLRPPAPNLVTTPIDARLYARTAMEGTPSAVDGDWALLWRNQETTLFGAVHQIPGTLSDEALLLQPFAGGTTVAAVRLNTENVLGSCPRGAAGYLASLGAFRGPGGAFSLPYRADGDGTSGHVVLSPLSDGWIVQLGVDCRDLRCQLSCFEP